jgi:hypothetical protein
MEAGFAVRVEPGRGFEGRQAGFDGALPALRVRFDVVRAFKVVRFDQSMVTSAKRAVLPTFV